MRASTEYSVWYHYAEGLGPSFVVEFEAEGRERSKEMKFLAYMGCFLSDVELTSANWLDIAIVHKIRKDARQNSIMRGPLTDEHRFTFMRIDENSKVRSSTQFSQ